MKNKDLIIAYAIGFTILARHVSRHQEPGGWLNLDLCTSEALRAFLGTMPMTGDGTWEFRVKPESDAETLGRVLGNN